MFRSRVRLLNKPEIVICFEQIERFNPAYFEIGDFMDHVGF